MQSLTRFPKIQKRPSLLGFLVGSLLVVSLALLACGPAATAEPQPTVPTQPPGTTPPSAAPTPGMLEKPAPIESVAIEVSAADPSVADLLIVSGLPNACYSFGDYSVERDGDAFRVEVYNLLPDDPMLACAEVYGMVTTRIPLEGGVETCKFYTVEVNDTTQLVQAIAPNVRCGASGDGSGQENGQWPEDSVTLPAGQKTSIPGTTLALTLLEVTEDSRCPSDVVCVWAGRATVVLSVEVDGADQGTVTLSIEGGQSNSTETVDAYTIELLELAPYPVSTGSISGDEYVARVLVTTS